jgi:hypothetical protein
MSAPSDYIWSLVSHLPSYPRGRQLMVMLQAYADESWTHKGPKVFVIGGFIAPAEIWARFSDEWQRVLDMKPRIDYFKNDEAVHLRGEFTYWKPWRRDERVQLLRNVIHAFRPGLFYLALKMKDYREVFANGDSTIKSEYLSRRSRNQTGRGTVCSS